MFVAPFRDDYLIENGIALEIKPHSNSAKNIPFFKEAAMIDFTQDYLHYRYDVAIYYQYKLLSSESLLFYAVADFLVYIVSYFSGEIFMHSTHSVASSGLKGFR